MRKYSSSRSYPYPALKAVSSTAWASIAAATGPRASGGTEGSRDRGFADIGYGSADRNHDLAFGVTGLDRGEGGGRFVQRPQVLDMRIELAVGDQPSHEVQDLP